MPNVPGVVVIATEKLDSLTAYAHEQEEGWRQATFEIERLEAKMKAHREVYVAAIAGSEKMIRELRVQLTEEHAAFLAEQVAGQDARRELEIALEEGEGLRATLNAVGSTRDYLREQLSRHHGGTAGCAVCGDYAMESARWTGNA